MAIKIRVTEKGDIQAAASPSYTANGETQPFVDVDSIESLLAIVEGAVNKGIESKTAKSDGFDFGGGVDEGEGDDAPTPV